MIDHTPQVLDLPVRLEIVPVVCAASLGIERTGFSNDQRLLSCEEFLERSETGAEVVEKVASRGPFRQKMGLGGEGIDELLAFTAFSHQQQ